MTMQELRTGICSFVSGVCYRFDEGWILFDIVGLVFVDAWYGWDPRGLKSRSRFPVDL